MIKPVAWMCDANDGINVDATARELVRDDYARFGRQITPLYAIPETHRIVSVYLLQEIVDDLFSHGITKAIKVERELQAIIDSK